MPFSLYSAAWASFRPVESQEQDTFKEGGVVFATEEAGHLSEKIIVAYRLIWRKIDDVVLKRPKTSRPSFWRKIELLRLNLQTCFDSFVAKFSRLKPFMAFFGDFCMQKITLWGCMFCFACHSSFASKINISFLIFGVKNGLFRYFQMLK